MKQELLKLMSRLGVFGLSRLINSHRPLILTYHRFTSHNHDDALPASVFMEQLEYLTKRYRIVPLSEIADYLRRGARPPAGMAAITIDDGYIDAYEIAYPLLHQYRIPATLFVATDFVDRRKWLWTDIARYLLFLAGDGELNVSLNGSNLRLALNDRNSRHRAASLLNDRLKLMDEDSKWETLNRIATMLETVIPALPTPEFSAINWQQAREMDAAGIAIGSHTVTHPILTRVDDHQLMAELDNSRARIEEMLGHPVELFCYPNGDFNERVRKEVERSGYKVAVTCESGLNNADQDLLGLRRIHTLPGFVNFTQDISGFGDFKDKLRSFRPTTTLDNGTQKLSVTP